MIRKYRKVGVIVKQDKRKGIVLIALYLVTTLFFWMFLNISTNYFVKVIEMFLSVIGGNEPFIDHFKFEPVFLIKADETFPWYAVAIFTVVLMLMSGRKISKRILRRLFPHDDIEGSSRWARKKEIKAYLTEVNKNELHKVDDAGVILAKIDDNLYMDTGTVNSLFIGTTRSGKGQFFVMHTVRALALAKNKQSMVVNDPKGELLESTYDFLMKEGYRVLILNFRHPNLSSRYNPLQPIIDAYVDAMGESDDEKDFTRAVELTNDFAGIVTDNPKSDPVWPESAKSLLTAMILYLIEDGYKRNCLDKVNMYSVYNFFLEFGTKNIQQGNIKINALDQLFSALPIGNIAKLAYATSKFADGEMRSSIFATLSNSLQIFSDAGIAKLTSGNDINFHDLIDSERPTAIFMVVPDEKISRHVLASIFVNQCYSQLVDIANNYERQILPRRVQFILDEFGNMVKIPDMSVKVTVCLGRNILFNLYVQSLSQIEEKYDKHPASTIQGNCGNLIYINSMDQDTNEYVSKLLDNRTTEYMTYSGEHGNLLDSNQSTHLKGRRLMDSAELRRMEFGECVVIRQRCYPIHTKFEPFYLLKLPVTSIEKMEVVTTKNVALSKVLYPIDELGKPVADKSNKARQTKEQSIINALNLHTKKELGLALDDGDFARAVELAREVLKAGKISQEEYEIFASAF